MASRGAWNSLNQARKSGVPGYCPFAGPIPIAAHELGKWKRILSASAVFVSGCEAENHISRALPVPLRRTLFGVSMFVKLPFLCNFSDLR